MHLLARHVGELPHGEGDGSDERRVHAERALGRDGHRDVAPVGTEVLAVRHAVADDGGRAHEHRCHVVRVAEEVVAARLVAAGAAAERAARVTRLAKVREALLQRRQVRLFRRGEPGRERMQYLCQGALGDIARRRHAHLEAPREHDVERHVEVASLEAVRVEAQHAARPVLQRG